MTHVDALPNTEPLVRLSDLDEYRQGLARILSGEWDDERWTAFRVRFGIYGQRQTGVQMVRVKVPGGIVPVAWLKTLAEVNRTFAGGPAHITTRQDFQLYHVPLRQTDAALEALYTNGVTTRETGGNTLRNMSSCALAGACPRELVDAGQVSAQLARAFLRHPLVQHMPRKFKLTVSGCATDCASTSIHDLGLIAVERDGIQGFRVFAGGGLGAAPHPAAEVLPFVTEEQLPAALEATVRVHQRYSDRVNRNASRIKYLNKRFGAEKFAALIAEEFDRLKDLPQRPWNKLPWRQPDQAPVARTPTGLVPDHDGNVAVVVYVPLGIVSSDQFQALYDIAVAAGVVQLRTTRDQNIAFLGVPPAKVEAVVAGVKAIGFDVPASATEIPDIISCPGTTTCRIGITSSQLFATTLEPALKVAGTDQVAVRVSGCQNSCGLHHFGDIGLHGMAKKIDGRQAPHYQLHFGGDARTGAIALAGPVIPARLADRAVALLRGGWVSGRGQGEAIRAWAERLGKAGLADLLAPLEGADADGLFVDWGQTEEWVGPGQARGDCAAPFAFDEGLADLADDGLIGLDRFAAIGRTAEAFAVGGAGAVFAARRLLLLRGQPAADEITAPVAFANLRSLWYDAPSLLAVLGTLETQRDAGDLGAFREAVAVLIDTVRTIVAAPPAAAAEIGDLAAILGGGE